MKLLLSEIKPNPFKKQINGGKLDEETIAKIRSNIKELGLMGALPVFKKDGQYYLVAGHHRKEALKREYGNDFSVEVVVHNYNEDAVLRGMVIENLSQRNGEFREELENLVLVRGYLQDHPEITRPVTGQVKSNRADGRGGGIIEPGSVKHISLWLDKNSGDVMKESKIADYLRIHDNLSVELLEKVQKTPHVKRELQGDIITVETATQLSSVTNPDEQKVLAEILTGDEVRNNRERRELMQTYKSLPEEDKEKVLSGELHLADVKRVEPEALSSGQMSLRFNKRASELVIEMRDLRRTLSQFRRERLFDQFTPHQRESFRDRLSVVKKEYTALMEELEESMVVLV